MFSILIIGCGSIGERHLRCFQKTGRCTVEACDTSAGLLETVGRRHGVATHASMEAALLRSRFDAAVVATPASLHLPMALQLLGAGLHVLIEKPLAVEDSLVPEVRRAIGVSGRHVAVAYVYHLMPWITEARQFLRAGDLGRLLQVCVTSGQHFPTYRPAYRDTYYARRETGGGTVQDALTHLVNAVEWMAGPCTRVYCDLAHQTLEGVTVEDTVTVSARHGSVLASYAMNQFQAPNETTLQFHAELGSVRIEVHRQRWGVMRHGDPAWTWHASPPMERDALFVAQANAFLDGIEGRPAPLASFEEAVQTLRFNQAALRSADTSQPVTIP